MKVNLDTDNYFKITGTIVRVNVYANGKACNVIIGVGENKISVKSFSPDVFNVLSSVKVEYLGNGIQDSKTEKCDIKTITP